MRIIELKPGEIPNGPPESAKIDPEHLKTLATEAGLEWVESISDLLPDQNDWVFQKS